MEDMSSTCLLFIWYFSCHHCSSTCMYVWMLQGYVIWMHICAIK